MAEIISLGDLLRARRREQELAYARQCVDLIELNLRLAVERFATASRDEQPARARQVRILGELLEYAVRAC